MSISVLTSVVFASVSLVAGVLNVIFLIRSGRNYSALQKSRNGDPVLRRISTGFIYIWIFVILSDVVRVMVGLGVLLHDPQALYLLLLSPFGSFLIAVIGLRSFR